MTLSAQQRRPAVGASQRTERRHTESTLRARRHRPAATRRSPSHLVRLPLRRRRCPTARSAREAQIRPRGRRGTHRIGDRHRVAPLLDDVPGALVDCTAATHRQPFVTRPPAPDRCGSPRRRRRRPPGHRAPLPTLATRQIEPLEHAAPRLPVHRRSEHGGITDEFAAGDRELVDAGCEEPFDRVGIRGGPSGPTTRRRRSIRDGAREFDQVERVARRGSRSLESVASLAASAGSSRSSSSFASSSSIGRSSMIVVVTARSRLVAG